MKGPVEPAVARYRAAFAATGSDDAPADSARFVVLDCETTGLDPRRDRLVSIGAVAVCGGEIVLEDSFEALLKIDHNRAAVTVHGITRDQARDGLEEEAAMSAFLDYVRDGIVVGHHVGHDVAAIDAALLRSLGTKLRNRWLDTMDLTLHLERAGAFADHGPITNVSLDSLCHLFGVTPHDRHTAPGDALLTALVFLKLLRLGRRFGRDRVGALCEHWPVATTRE